MVANRTAAGISPQLAKLLVLFLITTVELTWGQDCPVCPVVDKSNNCETFTEFVVQLRWFKSAQFAGFYAAQELGYWRADCLNVIIYQRTSNASPHLLNNHADAAIPHYL
jgi:ABC-type nitrate/sulfonate/bicarbonate transport system substrate-binding protein